MELLTGFGLATAAGLNAYIPLLALGLLSRFTDLVTLPHGWTWLENGWVMAIVAVCWSSRSSPTRSRRSTASTTPSRPLSGRRPAASCSGRAPRPRPTAVADPGAFAQSGQWIPVGDRCRCRAAGLADEIGRAPGRQCRHGGNGRAGAEHGRGRHQRRTGVRWPSWSRRWCWWPSSRWSGPGVRSAAPTPAGATACRQAAGAPRT